MYILHLSLFIHKPGKSHWDSESLFQGSPGFRGEPIVHVLWKWKPEHQEGNRSRHGENMQTPTGIAFVGTQPLCHCLPLTQPLLTPNPSVPDTSNHSGLPWPLVCGQELKKKKTIMSFLPSSAKTSIRVRPTTERFHQYLPSPALANR